MRYAVVTYLVPLADDVELNDICPGPNVEALCLADILEDPTEQNLLDSGKATTLALVRGVAASGLPGAA